MTDLNLSPKEQRDLDDVISALDHLYRTRGEPSLGGEQHYNRLHLAQIARECVDLGVGRGQAFMRLLTLSRDIFLELVDYRDVPFRKISATRKLADPFRGEMPDVEYQNRQLRIQLALIEPRPAWIEKKGDRFHVIERGTLFKGTRNPVSKTWGSRRGARDYISQNHLTLMDGDCPLPEVTQAQRDAYQNRPKIAPDRAVDVLALEAGISEAEARSAIHALAKAGFMLAEKTA